MIIDVDRHGRFRLPPTFLGAYENRPVPWGFGALSEVTFLRTYSRNGELWWQTCRRVIEGMFTLLRAHCRERVLHWDESRALAMAKEAYQRLWCFQWTPPGRGLWMMGTDFVYERGGTALNSCGFVSTRSIGQRYADPFVWLLRTSMLGVGVGFDTRGAGSTRIRRPSIRTEPYVIEDSREGWAEALRQLLDAYAGDASLPVCWDYSQIRDAGEPLQGFGGYASGPEPLREMLEGLQALYEHYVDRQVDSRLIVDTMNLIGRCVVAGGIRRSAQIAFGSADDMSFLDLKRDPQRLHAYGWVSNNSIIARPGMDYRAACERTRENGEPGYLWLENARNWGRSKDPPNAADEGAEGSNPCVEQTLWDRELCTLVETYPAQHDNYRDYARTVRLAFLYGKAVTLVPTGLPHSDAIMQRNRRIGCSMTGVVQAINRHGYRPFLRWCDRAYRLVQEIDAKDSRWLCVPRSIKTTSVKPSGTVSLLAGATPGVHWDHAPYYLRRIRVRRDNLLAEVCRRAGYVVEDDVYDAHAAVISFPVKVANTFRCKRDVPLWEKVDLAAQMQRYWSDNQVSCTADFYSESEAASLPRILSAYEDRLKGIAFLPTTEHGYEQPPYLEIEASVYREMVARLQPLPGDLPHEISMEERFCDDTSCQTRGTSRAEPMPMKRQIEMSPVEDCAATQCAYNQDHLCCAKAITIGGSTHPACDTFVSDDAQRIPAHVAASRTPAGVGACKTVLCQHNQNLECGATAIRVKTHGEHADCSTFET